jgi:hypothetical protein
VVEEMFEMTKDRITDEHNNPECQKEIVVCGKCGHYGHKTRHLDVARNKGIDLFNMHPDQRFYALEAVSHACFSENKDISRNTWCYTKQITVGKDEVYFTIRLKNYENRLPEFVTERQKEAEEFDEIPVYEWNDDVYYHGIQDD